MDLRWPAEAEVSLLGRKGVYNRSSDVRPDSEILDRGSWPVSHSMACLTRLPMIQIYANGPSASDPTKPSSSSGRPNGGPAPDPIAIAGLDPNYVNQFVAMGFPQAQVIEVMKRLNYRGKNVSTVGEDAVVEALLR